MWKRRVPWPQSEKMAAWVAKRPERFWLDSARPHPQWGRFSCLTGDPMGGVEFTQPNFGQLKLPGAAPISVHWEDLPQFLTVMDTAPQYRGFAGGWVGYRSYEAFGPILKLAPQRLHPQLGLGKLFFTDTGLILDHQKQSAEIFSWGLDGHLKNPNPERAQKKINDWAREWEGLESLERNQGRTTEVQALESKESYQNKVCEIREAIARGDFYQVNLAQKFIVKNLKCPVSFYLKWRECSPSFQMSLFHMKEGWVLSASPETLLEAQSQRVVSFPIKGTRPKYLDRSLDQNSWAELQNSAKDKAELMMIVDLVRNDLGRVCEFGSVRVEELNQIMTLSQLHHLYAKISGDLMAGQNHAHAFQALFPGGSITGAPKQKAMEWIQKLESFPRGIFTGSLGYFSIGGGSQWNIAIRSAFWREALLEYYAGAGIVYDSDPKAEYEETWVKTRGLIEACR